MVTLPCLRDTLSVVLDHDELITAADIVRTVLFVWGIALGLVCFKFAYITLRNGEGFRTYGLASYAFLLITPVFVGLFRYGQPLLPLPTIAYAAGLVCGTLALRYVVTLSPEWLRLFSADRKRRKRAPRV